MSEPVPPAEPVLPPELQPAQALIERGDFRSARRELAGLAASGSSAEVQAAARDLQTRLASDPRALWAGLAALVLLAWIVGAYVL